MDVKDVRKVFKELPFTGKEEIEAWVQAVLPVPAPELVKLLAILTDKSLAADNGTHRARCYAFLKLAENVRDPQLFVHYARALRSADTVVAGKIVGTQEMDDATAAKLKAEAQSSRIAAELVAERAQIGVLNANRAEAISKVAEAKAMLLLTQNDLGKTVIRAPIDGVIGNRAVRVGQVVSPGTQLLWLVPNDVHIVANFKETQIGHMQPGQEVKIEIDAFPGQELTGTVDSFSPASGAEFSLLPAENATGNFTKIVQRVPVRIALPDNSPLHGLLRPGLSVEVAVDTASVAAPALASAGGWLFGAANASSKGKQGE